MTQWLALTVGLGLLFLGFEALHRGLAQANLIRTLRTIRATPVADPRPDLQLVHGPLEGEPLLYSPYQGRACLYYFFRVTEPREGGRPVTLATGKEWTLVRVRDASGAAAIEAWPALVASPRRFEDRLTGLTRIPPHLADFFERAGIDDKHLPRFSTLVVHEYTLEPGDAVYVTGTARLRAGQKVFYRKKRSPLIVSAEPDVGYLGGLRHELFLYAALAPLLLVAGLVLTLLATVA